MANIFTHGGSVGDIIYHLAPIKDMGGGKLYLHKNAHPHWRMRPEIIESLLTLLRVQPYITEAGVCESPQGINLDDWRRHWRGGYNLSDMVSAWMGIEHTSRTDPWLFVPKKKRIAPVVIHRSPRYHVDSFPWPKIVEKYKDAVFVGSVDEHGAFCERFGPVSYWRTETYLDLAEVIEGADLFIGNQSSPAAIAQGLRKNMVQETMDRHHWAWNCHWDRPGMIHGYGPDVELPL